MKNDESGEEIKINQCHKTNELFKSMKQNELFSTTM